MRQKGILFTLFHQPLWVYLAGVFLSMNLTISLAWILGGGKGLIFISSLSLLFYKDIRSRLSTETAITIALHENPWILRFLIPYYLMTVVSWIHSPYVVTYEDIGFIWKTHLGNILALLVCLLISRSPKLLRFLIFFSLPFVLHYCLSVGSVLNRLGGEARSYLNDPTVGGLGGSGTWQIIAMYAVMLLGQVFSEKNHIFKISGILCVVYMFRCILRAGFATPVGLLLIGTMAFSTVYFFYGKKTRNSALFKWVIIIGGIVGALSLFYKIAHQEGDAVTSKSVTGRFYNLSKNPLGGGYGEEGAGFEGSRLSYMSVGWHAFLESPIIGKGGPNPDIRHTNISSCGHHSIIDYFGHLGIIGGGGYLLFVILCFKNVLRRYKMTKSWIDAGSFGVMVMYFVGGVVNPMWMGGTMSVMYLLCLPVRNKQIEWEYQVGIRQPGEDFDEA